MQVETSDLVDSVGVAAVLGLRNYRSVNTYKTRYRNSFPEPVIVTGRCALWRRQDIEEWARNRPRRSK